MSAPVTTLMTFLFGVLNVTLASFFVILTVIVGVGIRLVNGYSKWTSYQIMLSISFFELVQLVSHLFSGITLLVNCEMPVMLCEFFGSTMSSAWVTSNILGILLAFHRMLSVAFPSKEPLYFSGIKKKVIFVLTYAVFPFFAGLQWIGLASYAYQKGEFSWDYDFSLPLSHLCDNIDAYSAVAFLLTAILCYAVIFHTLSKKDVMFALAINSKMCRLVLPTSATVTYLISIKINKSRERSFTIQVFVYCLYGAFTFILWQFLEPLLEPKPLIFFWTCLPWLFWNGMHSIICLIFNRSIRENVLNILCCRVRRTHVFKMSSANPHRKLSRATVFVSAMHREDVSRMS